MGDSAPSRNLTSQTSTDRVRRGPVPATWTGDLRAPPPAGASTAASGAEARAVFLLLLAVPALLVVVLGYVIGHGLWAWLGGLIDAGAGTSIAGHAEIAGWATGALLLAATVWCLLVIRRRRAG